MKFRILVGSLLVWGSLPGWAVSGIGALALSGGRSFCAFSPSLNRSETAAESASFQEKKGDRKADAEQLARALDYFASEKFHECLVLLQPLNRRYKLNPRYRAYLAVCLYYEWEYAEAIRLFDEVLPQLQGLAPHELSLYYWMDAESYFALQQYDRALPLYGKMLPIVGIMRSLMPIIAWASAISSQQKVRGLLLQKRFRVHRKVRGLQKRLRVHRKVRVHRQKKGRRRRNVSSFPWKGI